MKTLNTVKIEICMLKERVIEKRGYAKGKGECREENERGAEGLEERVVVVKA